MTSKAVAAMITLPGDTEAVSGWVQGYSGDRVIVGIYCPQIYGRGTMLVEYIAPKDAVKIEELMVAEVR